VHDKILTAKDPWIMYNLPFYTICHTIHFQYHFTSKFMPNSDNDNFFNLVFDVVRLIPPGRVSSYGAIAKYLGAARSSRMVGWAMNASHGIEPEVPAHRVVNRFGFLSGKAHFRPPEKMENALKAEGIIIKDDQIQNFDQLFWDPSKELAL